MQFLLNLVTSILKHVSFGLTKIRVHIWKLCNKFVRSFTKHIIKNGALFTKMSFTKNTAIDENVMLLEVKWDEYLPNVIRQAAALKGKMPSAFSKYAACRVYY